MCNCLAAGLFAGGALYIDVNPMIVAGQICESVYLLLCDLKPFRCAKRFAPVLRQVQCCLNYDHSSPNS